MQGIPKLEVHAHLNGSISRATIKKLLDLKVTQGHAIPDQAMTFVEKGSRTHEEIFQMFSLLHVISDSIQAVYTIAYDVIHDFAEDGVKYLELRTTPRAVSETGMTVESYVDTVLKAMCDCKQEKLDIIVRLILSIDRQKSREAAMRTVQLAERYRETSGGDLVGIDFSGKPTVGNVADFIPALKEAKNKGLKVTVHLSEELNRNCETESVLREVQPDRIGHGVYLHPSVGGTQEIVDLVLAQRIPLEICMTSNVKCKLMSSYAEHHAGFWLDKNHPCIISTDDKGVFDTTLSQEYQIAADTFMLTHADLWRMGYQNIDYIFADDSVKNELKNKWQQMKPAD